MQQKFGEMSRHINTLEQKNRELYEENQKLKLENKNVKLHLQAVKDQLSKRQDHARRYDKRHLVLSFICNHILGYDM